MDNLRRLFGPLGRSAAASSKQGIALVAILCIQGIALLSGLGTSQAKESVTGGSGDADWPSIGRVADETYYSPLSQINTSNVSRLKLEWFIDLPTMTSAVSTPLEVDGIVYFAVGHSFVYAVEAA
jgi:quinohemoprotein ethanol dehydrogenase